MPSASSPQSAPLTQVTLLYGSSETLKQRHVDQLIAARLRPEQYREGLTFLAGDLDAGRLKAELGARSLLAEDRVIVIKRVEQLKADDQRQLAQALGRLPATTSVILTCGEIGKWNDLKPDVIADLGKAVKHIGDLTHVPTPREKALNDWIVEEARCHTKTIADTAIELLRELTEDDVDMLVAEIGKVATYAGDRAQIARADVQAVGFGSQQGNVFELTEAIGLRNPTAALRALTRILPPGTARGQAQGLLGMISRQLRLVWQARVAAREGYRIDRTTQIPDELTAKFPKDHSIVAAVRSRRRTGPEMVAQAKKFTDPQIARALARVHETELALKGQTGEQIDERPALETLIVELCQL